MTFRDGGIRIALDDFGAGYASIGYMRDLEFDVVKLDGSLIRDVTANGRSRKLLMGVLQLCRSIGVEITAEQVETAEQLRALQAFPIDNVQGFHLGQPLTASSALRLGAGGGSPGAGLNPGPGDPKSRSGGNTLARIA